MATPLSSYRNPILQTLRRYRPSNTRQHPGHLKHNTPFRGLASATSGLKINGDRLWKDLHHTCQWGTGTRWGDAEHETGMQRLALSDEDKHVRDWFVETVRSLGCKVSIDAMGNIFAVRPGKKHGPPIAAGSHLDTQPTGGRYDGILGVHAGIEMLKTLHEHKIETQHPIGVVNWTNEEGARFPLSMVSSGVWAGTHDISDAYSLADVRSSTQTMKSELQRIGYLGDIPASHTANLIAAHFELHIEQGPILERQGRKIGIVTGAQAYEWNYILLRGRESHSGTTAFEYRRDPLSAAARMIELSNCVAKQHGGLATTGILTLSPGSINTIPGEVSFSLDVRSQQDDVLETMMGELRTRFAQIAHEEEQKGGGAGGVEISWNQVTKSPAVHFQDQAVGCVREACRGIFGDEMQGLTAEMVSGAGHDSVNVSRRAPTAMIFVPCRDGISHNPREYCEKDDCALGAQVLMDSVLGFDRAS